MKNCILKISIVSLYLFAGSILYAQDYNYFEGFTNMPVRIDTSQQDNLWQIGMPSKSVFSNAYSQPNAIVTDTSQPYPQNNISSFELTISQNVLWSYPNTIFMFLHKAVVNPGHAGGWIEASYDGGGNWANVMTDSVYSIAVLGHVPTDILPNGEIGFGKSEIDWQQTILCWGALRGLGTRRPDSILLRFNFMTDSVASPDEGWMIDNLEAYPEFVHTLEELRAMVDLEQLVIYPNPASDHVQVLFKTNQNSSVKIELFSPNGARIAEYDYGKLPKGVHSEHLSLALESYSNKYIFLRLLVDDKAYLEKVLLK